MTSARLGSWLGVLGSPALAVQVVGVYLCNAVCADLRMLQIVMVWIKPWPDSVRLCIYCAALHGQALHVSVGVLDWRSVLTAVLCKDDTCACI